MVTADQIPLPWRVDHAPTVQAGDIITGERLQALASITVATESILNFHKSLAGAGVRAVCKVEGTHTSIDPGTRAHEVLDGYPSIFVYTHLVPSFLEHILPRMTKPFVLMTHNSDDRIDEPFRPALDHPLILHWFAQNAAFSHPKLTALPIGIANAQWAHGNIQSLQEVMALSRPKTAAVYLNFEISTNPGPRSAVFVALRKRPFIVLGQRRPYRDYLADMAGHRFCVSPPGNGIDCHRTWECLYLGVVPIVRREPASLFAGLPVIEVDDFAAMTLDSIQAAWKEIRQSPRDLSPLRLSTWRARVDAAVAGKEIA